MQFLLHDAAEAYIVDLPKPLKKTRFSQHPMGWLFGKIYQRVEHKFEEAIAEKFHLEPFPPAIKMMDNRLLVTEKRDLLSYSARAFKWAEDSVQKLDTKIIPLPPREAEMQYLDLYYELKARLGR